MKVPRKQDSPFIVRKGRKQVSQEIYVWHWTAQSPKARTLDVLKLLARGRVGVPGPLCSVATEANGQRWRVAADSVKSNNLGKFDVRVWNAALAGKPLPSFSGKPPAKYITVANSRTHGNEIMISGSRESWTLAAYCAAVVDSAEWCAENSRPVSRVLCHSELAYWRKVDVSSVVNMDAARADIQRFMASKELPKGIPFVGEAKPTLQKGSETQWVNSVRAKLGFSTKPKPKFTGWLHKQVQRFQAAHGLTPDGVVGPKTWDALNAPAAFPAKEVPTGRPFTAAQVQWLQQHFKQKES